MAPFVFTNGKLWIQGFDVSGDSNVIATDYGCEAKDNTTMGTAGVRSNAGGLKTLALQNEGFWDADGGDEPDDVFFSRVGTTGIPVSVSAEGGTEGDIAYTFEAMLAKYTQRGQIGEMYGFAVEASSSSEHPLVRGLVLANGAISGDGNGTGRQVGAAASGESLYGSLHVLALGAGTSLVVTLESDVDNTFASATSRIAFTAKTAIGAEFATLAGPITDEWYRLGFAFTGGTATATVVVVVGIK